MNGDKWTDLSQGSESLRYMWNHRAASFHSFTGRRILRLAIRSILPLRKLVSLYLTLQFIQQLLQLVDLRAPVLLLLRADLWKYNHPGRSFTLHIVSLRRLGLGYYVLVMLSPTTPLHTVSFFKLLLFRHLKLAALYQKEPFYYYVYYI